MPSYSANRFTIDGLKKDCLDIQKALLKTLKIVGDSDECIKKIANIYLSNRGVGESLEFKSISLVVECFIDTILTTKIEPNGLLKEKCPQSRHKSTQTKYTIKDISKLEKYKLDLHNLFNIENFPLKLHEIIVDDIFSKSTNTKKMSILIDKLMDSYLKLEKSQKNVLSFDYFIDEIKVNISKKQKEFTNRVGNLFKKIADEHLDKKMIQIIYEIEKTISQTNNLYKNIDIINQNITNISKDASIKREEFIEILFICKLQLNEIKNDYYKIIESKQKNQEINSILQDCIIQTKASIKSNIIYLKANFSVISKENIKLRKQIDLNKQENQKVGEMNKNLEIKLSEERMDNKQKNLDVIAKDLEINSLKNQIALIEKELVEKQQTIELLIHFPDQHSNLVRKNVQKTQSQSISESESENKSAVEALLLEMRNQFDANCIRIEGLQAHNHKLQRSIIKLLECSSSSVDLASVSSLVLNSSSNLSQDSKSRNDAGFYSNPSNKSKNIQERDALSSASKTSKNLKPNLKFVSSQEKFNVEKTMSNMYPNSSLGDFFKYFEPKFGRRTRKK
ncbi:MAG: hypothetical protein MHPSP_001884 [Paramarteilia canceri]